MKTYRFLILLIVFIVACDEKIFTFDVDCDHCYTSEPEFVDLEIFLTLRSNSDQVPIVVYIGNMEDNVVEFVDTAYESPYYLSVRADRRYTVKAEYKRNDRVLYAVDATRPKVLKVSDTCEETCFVTKNNLLHAEINPDLLHEILK
jgi:hypothetical protein